MYDIYEDRIRIEAKELLSEFTSPYQDLRTYASSVTPGIRLAINVIKPIQVSYILVQLHGWHMSMPRPRERHEPLDGNEYLIVQADMRGRAFSQGEPDCNGLELMDIYDAVQFVREHYANWIVDPSLVYLEGGSGGGGNVLAAVNKFPDLFAAASALYGISDYAVWYGMDSVGEFRDDMDIWVGCKPEGDPERYRARGGLHLAENQLTPLYMAHGDCDDRVQVVQSRLYVGRMRELGRGSLVRYDDMAGVGGFGHGDNMTEEQKTRLEAGKRENKELHRKPIDIPRQGRFAVGGYLVTKQFQLWLGSINQFAYVNYDLAEERFTVQARSPYPYEIVLQSGVKLHGKAEVVA